MKAINIWMLGTVLFSGLISCEMKEEIFGKDIPTETGYLTLDVNFLYNNIGCEADIICRSIRQ